MVQTKAYFVIVVIDVVNYVTENVVCLEIRSVV